MADCECGGVTARSAVAGAAKQRTIADDRRRFASSSRMGRRSRARSLLLLRECCPASPPVESLHFALPIPVLPLQLRATLGS